MNIIENQNQKSKLVFDFRICRKLIHENYKVIDCKPLKTDKTRTVLVFEDTPEFEEAFARITAEYKAKEDARRAPINEESEQLVEVGA